MQLCFFHQYITHFLRSSNQIILFSCYKQHLATEYISMFIATLAINCHNGFVSQRPVNFLCQICFPRQFPRVSVAFIVIDVKFLVTISSTLILRLCKHQERHITVIGSFDTKSNQMLSRNYKHILNVLRLLVRVQYLK